MKTVAICEDAPLGEKYDELWGCNRWYKKNLDTIDKLFIFHKQVYLSYGEDFFDWKDIYKKSKEYGFEIFLLHDIPEIKEYTKYPINEIRAYFKTEYFCTSMDYMIAYAIYTKWQKIIMDFKFALQDTPYTDSLWEKAGVEHWLGRAMGLGIKIKLTPQSNIFYTRTGERYAING